MSTSTRAVIALTVLGAFPVCHAAAAETREFKIEPQTLSQALMAFSEQSQLVVTASSDLLEGKNSPRLYGAMTPEAALMMLLEGSGLKYVKDKIGDRTVIVVRDGASTVGERPIAGQWRGAELLMVQAGALDSPATDYKSEGKASSDHREDGQSNSLEEIIVTARKVSERLQDVPISVTVFSGEQLEELGAVDVKNVLMMVPGLAYEGTERGLSRYNIRGVSTTTRSPTVGIYLDDISLTTLNFAATGIQGAFDPVFFDFERLEVLKGPQGTLYGGNAMGGAIKYVTARPNLSQQSSSVAAGVSTTAHGSESYNAEAVVNLPIVSDVLAVRGGFYYRREGGYIDNVANADVQNPLVSSTPFPVYTPSTQPSQSTLNKDDYNDGDTYVGRLSLLWQPDPSFTIRPTIYYQESTFANPGSSFANLPGLTSSYRLTQDTVDRATIASLEVVKDWGGVELTSLTAHFDREALFERDYSFLIGGISQGALYDANSLAYYPTQTEQFSQEFRIASDRKDNSRLDWTLGLFYSTVDHGFDGTAFTYDVGLPDDIFFTTDTQVELDQSAVFGEATFGITDNLDVSAGARVFWIEQSNVTTTTFPGFNFPTPITTSLATKEDGVNPRVAMEYRLSKDHLLYTSAAKGFRPGFAQDPTIIEATPACVTAFTSLGYSGVPTSIDSDSLWTYELGSKNEFDQGRILLNGSVFYSDWSDIQQTIFLNCALQFNDNAGAARLQGAAIEGRVNLTPDFQFGMTAGYVDARISETAPGGVFRRGDTIQGVPEWTASAYVLYGRPISGDWNVKFRADYQYRSEARRSFTRTISIAYPGGVNTVLPNPIEFQEGYDVASGYVALDNGATSLRLYINNAFDERSILDRDIFSFTDSSTVIRPRTIGLEVRRQF